MPQDQKSNIAEATRLTRAGRLGEAMALLKDIIPRPSAPAQPPRSATGSMGRVGSGRIDELAATVADGLRGALTQLGGLGAGHGLPEKRRGRPSEASAGLPAGAVFEERRFANEFGTRSYKLYRPDRADRSLLPLVVMLHGCKQSPDDFAAGTRMNELAEERDFLVAYPGQPSSANPSRCWNWFSAGDQIRDQGEPSLIAGITRQVMAEELVDPGSIYVAGLSAGGAEAAIMGSAYPDLYAAVCVHSGLACGAAKDMPSAFSAMRQGGIFALSTAKRPVPTIVFHGDVDGTVHHVNGDQVIAQAKAAGDFETTVTRGRSAGGIGYTRTVQANRSGHPVLEHWTLHGAGHAWSGGSPTGSYTEPRGPDASREMMRFFFSQRDRALSEAAE